MKEPKYAIIAALSDTPNLVILFENTDITKAKVVYTLLTFLVETFSGDKDQLEEKDSTATRIVDRLEDEYGVNWRNEDGSYQEIEHISFVKMEEIIKK